MIEQRGRQHVEEHVHRHVQEGMALIAWSARAVAVFPTLPTPFRMMMRERGSNGASGS